jgi:hypothetical protein
MATTPPGNPQQPNWTETENTAPILTVESRGPFTGLPERLKGYRPGQKQRRPTGETKPEGSQPPEDNKPTE